MRARRAADVSPRRAQSVAWRWLTGPLVAAMVLSNMGSRRTAWHVLFTLLLEERGPPGIVVRAEVVLTSEPQRADLLLLRQADVPRADEQSRVLRGLWPRLSLETLVEFKSVGRPPRLGDWGRLLGYGAQYWSMHAARLDRAQTLTLALVVPSSTPTLTREAEALGLHLRRLDPGYYRVTGSVFPMYLVVLAEVAAAERDDLLGWFAGATIEQDDTRWWLMAHTDVKDGDTRLSEREGYREMLASFLAALPPEQRLAGLAPQERLAGLAPNESVLALPDEILARLPAEFLSTLPETVQAQIRQRLGAKRAGT